MKHLFIFLLCITSTAATAGDTAPWSKAVQGLRARLEVLPSTNEESPFTRVFIEFENVSDVMGQKRIPFSLDKLSLRVTDKDGNELPQANNSYDGRSPNWEPIALPFAGSIKFRISFPGLGYFPGRDKVIVDVNSSKAWVIPQDGKTYFLSGTFAIEQEANGHWKEWSGTLGLPMVQIPDVKANAEQSLAAESR